MKKKHVVLIAGAVVTVYILPKVLDGIADQIDKVTATFEEMSLEFRLAAVCVRIVGEHPELHDDPRLIALGTDIEFFEIKKNFNQD